MLPLVWFFLINLSKDQYWQWCSAGFKVIIVDGDKFLGAYSCIWTNGFPKITLARLQLIYFLHSFVQISVNPKYRNWTEQICIWNLSFEWRFENQLFVVSWNISMHAFHGGTKVSWELFVLWMISSTLPVVLKTFNNQKLQFKRD